MTPVYPRSRGEHGTLPLYEVSYYGLSPLARGTLRNQALPLLLNRFIPARAGNTNTTSRNTCNLAVYPRSRGEHTLKIWNQAT